MTKQPAPRPSKRGATRRGAKRLDDIIARHAPAVDHERQQHTYDLAILRSLRQVIRATDLYSRRLKVTHNLTSPQLVCLLTVAAEGPMTSTLLAQRVHLSTSTIVGILDRLESKELVARTRSDNDRRVIHVSATGKGKRMARFAPSPLQDHLVQALAGLTEREQRTIAQSVQRLAELMGASELDAAPLLGTGELDN
jgi:DNA-binding MarR family transcriptional regulator